MQVILVAVTIFNLLIGGGILSQNPIHFGSSNFREHGFGNVLDPQASITIRGEIISVVESVQKNGNTVLMHLTVKTGSDKEQVIVYFPPGCSSQSLGMRFFPKQRVEIKGKRMNHHGTIGILAAEVKIETKH